MIAISKLLRGLEECEGASCKVKHSCFVTGTLVSSHEKNVEIETLRELDRATTLSQEERLMTGIEETESSISAESHRVIRLHMQQDDGGESHITLVRSLSWIVDNCIFTGGFTQINMSHMGADGIAEVLAIEDCPEIRPGEGKLITGLFRHSGGIVYDLKLAGEEEPIGVTGTHPFWSMDRQDWISVADLEIGETLKAADGTTIVESLSLREGCETVYNIEVEGDHVYRVGESEVLVHNASVPVWTGSTHESCSSRIEHCPQIERSSGFSTTPNISTTTSSTHYGIILDRIGGTESERYNALPTGFKAIVTSTGGGSAADRRILPPGWDTTAPVGSIHRGHLLANDLGGPGGLDDGGRRNLVTQSKGTNLRVMRAVERGVTDLIGQGHRVYYQIVAVYASGATPTKLRIRACAKVGEEEYDATVVTHWEQGINV